MMNQSIRKKITLATLSLITLICVTGCSPKKANTLHSDKEETTTQTKSENLRPVATVSQTAYEELQAQKNTSENLIFDDFRNDDENIA